MKKSLKGALLSGLVFPGAGQLWLKCYLRGAALIVVVSAAMAVVVKNASQQAFAILEHMESEGGVIDIGAILNSAQRASDDAVIKAASALMVLCWVIGIIDAYLVGRKRDLADQPQDRSGSNKAVPR
jgi:hypothetical protein